MKDELFLVCITVFLTIIVGVAYEKTEKYKTQLNIKVAQYDSVVKYCAYKDSLIIDMATKINYDGIK